jgi:L-serine dehydratase
MYAICMCLILHNIHNYKNVTATAIFISVLELFKIDIGPSSSHTLGPMIAANDFIARIKNQSVADLNLTGSHIRCTLKGSLAFTGKGHSTDRAMALGLHGYLPTHLTKMGVTPLAKQVWESEHICIDEKNVILFHPNTHIIFDKGEPLTEHPNGMIFELIDSKDNTALSETYFSIGGGFINTLAEINQLQAPLKMHSSTNCRYPFDSANAMLKMATNSKLSIAQMKQANELEQLAENVLFEGMDSIWEAMKACLETGLKTEGILPGGLNVSRRAKDLYQSFKNNPSSVNINDWLCAYAMAVSEENAAGNMVVTAPTNGAAGVIPAVLYYFMMHENGTKEQARDFLLTTSAIGGLIKHNSSISGAEVGCQGEVGSAAAMVVTLCHWIIV